MFGHLGFSYVGLIYLLMLFIPNFVWAKHPPKGYSNVYENKSLFAFERVCQVLVTCVVLMFSDFNIKTISNWSIWLLVSFAVMLLYEISWIGYFSSGSTEENFYRSRFGIPVPFASLPVMGFLLLGIYGHVIWLIISVIILGVGHIGIHVQHVRRIKNRA